MQDGDWDCVSTPRPPGWLEVPAPPWLLSGELRHATPPAVALREAPSPESPGPEPQPQLQLSPPVGTRRRRRSVPRGGRTLSWLPRGVAGPVFVWRNGAREHRGGVTSTFTRLFSKWFPNVRLLHARLRLPGQSRCTGIPQPPPHPAPAAPAAPRLASPRPSPGGWRWPPCVGGRHSRGGASLIHKLRPCRQRPAGPQQGPPRPERGSEARGPGRRAAAFQREVALHRFHPESSLRLHRRLTPTADGTSGNEGTKWPVVESIIEPHPLTSGVRHFVTCIVLLCPRLGRPPSDHAPHNRLLGCPLLPFHGGGGGRR